MLIWLFGKYNMRLAIAFLFPSSMGSTTVIPDIFYVEKGEEKYKRISCLH